MFVGVLGTREGRQAARRPHLGGEETRARDTGKTSVNTKLYSEITTQLSQLHLITIHFPGEEEAR